MSVHVVNTHEAKPRLSELIREAEDGIEVIVARNGQPVAKIIALAPTPTGAGAGCVGGSRLPDLAAVGLHRVPVSSARLRTYGSIRLER